MNFSIHTIPRLDRSPDYTLLFTFLFLLGTGLAMLFSASYYRADALFGDPLQFVRNQTMYAGLGLCLALVAFFLPMNFIRKWIPLLMFITLALMILTFVPGVGVEYLGARRQIQIADYTFQPTELVKLTLILYLAHILGKKEERINDLFNSILPPLFIVVIFITLIYLQNDFSSAMFIAMICLSMFFVAGVKLRYFLALVFLIIPLALILLFSREHRVIRVLSFLEPGLDPSGSGYQVNASVAALRNGGVWGTGIGEGLQKLGQLPEAQSDFVFAVLGEELGFLGVLAILAIYSVFAWRGYSIALSQKSNVQGLMAYGITSMICIQAAVNMAVISGMIPATGIPMPFFSTGGSHLLITMILCGLLLNLSRQNSNQTSTHIQENGNV